MNKKVKRILSIVLAFIMVIGTIPLGILAEGGTEDTGPKVGVKDAAPPEDTSTGANAKNAIHAFVGVQVGGDVNLPLGGATGQQFTPIPGVKVYFQWTEMNEKYVSPVYTATSGADGQVHMEIKPYVAADGNLIKFDADTTISAGNERYRFWVDQDSIPEGYSLQYITGESVVFPQQGLPITQGGASSSTARNTHNNWKVLLREDPKDVMHKAPVESPAKSSTGGYLWGKVSWDYSSDIGGVKWSALADRTSVAQGKTVKASYLSDYALTKIYTPEVAEMVGLTDPKDIRGYKWTPAQEKVLQDWIREQVAADKENWIAETVSAVTDEKGNYLIQFNGTWGPLSDSYNASQYIRTEGQRADAHTWSKIEAERLGKVADSPNDGSFLIGAVDWNEKHINRMWMYISLDDSDDLRILTPYNNNTFTGRDDVWGIHNGWGLGATEGEFSVTTLGSGTFKADFSLAPEEIKFDITNYDTLANTAVPGDIAETKTTGLPKSGSNDQFRIVWYDDTGKVVDEGVAKRPNSEGELDVSKRDTTGVDKTTIYTAKLYRVDSKGNNAELLATDFFTVVYENYIGSRYEEVNFRNPNPLKGATYTAKNLPDGLVVDPATGNVSGVPTESGLFDVEILASVDKGEAGIITAGRTFKYLITDSPLEDALKDVAYTQEVKPIEYEGYVFKNVRAEFTKPVAGLAVTDGPKITGTATEITHADQQHTNVKVTYDVYQINSQNEEFLVKQDHVDNVPLKVKNVNFIAKYEEKEGAVGKETVIPKPTFTTPDNTPVDQPIDPKFEIITPNALKGTVSIGTDGEIKYTPDLSEAGKTLEIPVRITYEDGTFDEILVNIKVKDALSDRYEPTATRVEKDHGDPVTLDDIKNAVTVPDYPSDFAAAEITVDGELPDGRTTGDFEVEATLTYPDGSIDKVKVPITIKGENDQYVPISEVVVKLKGEGTTEQEIIDAVKVPDYPTDGQQPTVAIDDGQDLPDGNTQGEYFINTTVTYPDGTSETAVVRIVVRDRMSGSLTPEYVQTPHREDGKDSIIADPVFRDNNGLVVPTPSGAVFTLGENPPEGAAIDPVTGAVSYTISEGSSAEVTIPVVITYPDGSTDDIDVNVSGRPLPPEVQDITKGDDKIVVTAPTDGDKITVTLPGGSTVVAEKAGENWTVNGNTVPVNLAGQLEIPVDGEEIDPALGNVEVTVSNSDTNLASQPALKAIVSSVTIDNPKAGDKTVTGTGEPETTIVVTDSNGNKLGETTVDTDGTWKIAGEFGREIKELVANEVLTATQAIEGKPLTEVKAIVSDTDAHRYQPTYPVTEAKTGEDVTIPLEFKDLFGNPIEMPEGIEFTKQNSADDWYSVDKNTGDINYTIQGDLSTFEVPVLVTYKDGTSEIINATTIAAAPAKPIVDKVTAGNNKVVVKEPADANQVTVTPPVGDPVTATKTGDTWYVDGEAINKTDDGKLEIPVEPEQLPFGQVVKVTVTNTVQERESLPTFTTIVSQPVITNAKAVNGTKGEGEEVTTVDAITSPTTKVTISYPDPDGGEAITKTVTSDEKGDFKLEISPKLAKDTEITITPDGGTSVTVKVTEVDNTTPVSQKPTLDGMTAEDPTIKIGNVDPNADQITLKVGDTEVILSKDGDGNWTSDNTDYPVEKDGDGNLVVTPAEGVRDSIEDKQVVATATNTKDPTNAEEASDPGIYNLQADDNTTPVSQKPTLDGMTAEDPTIKIGNVDPNADQITLKVGDTEVILSKDADGNWTSDNTDYPVEKDGDGNLVVTPAEGVRDSIEDKQVVATATNTKDPTNAEEASDPGIYNLQADDNTTPVSQKPILGGMTAEDPTIKIGNVDPNADQITLKVGDTEVILSKDGDGNWTSDNTDYPVEKDGDGNLVVTPAEGVRDSIEDKQVVATATNTKDPTNAEEASDPGIYNLQADDNTTPVSQKPTLGGMTADDPTIKIGNVDPNADQITLKVGDTEVILSKDADGNWTSDNTDYPVEKDGDGNLVVTPAEGVRDSIEDKQVVATATNTKDPTNAEEASDPGIYNLQADDNTTPVSQKPTLDGMTAEDPTIKIGNVDPNADQITLKVGDTEVILSKDADGNWTSDNTDYPVEKDGDGNLVVTPVEGVRDSIEDKQVVATATNTKDPTNAEEASDPGIYNLQADDNTTPVSQKPTLDGMTAEDPTIKIGNVDPNADQITLKVGDTEVILSKDADGNWTSDNTDYPVEKDGDGNLVVTPAEGVRDSIEDQAVKATAKNSKADGDAGKSTEGIYNLQEDVNTPTPTEPTVNKPSSNDNVISGKGQPGAVITVTDSDGNTLGTADVDGSGNWSVRKLTRPLKSGEELTITQQYEDDTSVTKTTVGSDGGSSKPGNSGGIILKPWDPTKPEAPIVEKELHKEYMYGYPDHSFGPNLNITRAEAAAMISRLMGYDMSDNSKPNFADVESGWYNSAINAAVKNGLMKGYPDGSFKANEKITRAEFAQIIKNIDKANSAQAPFADVTGHWAEVAIGQAYGNGRIDGYPDGTFKPNNAITRAEAVKIVNSVFDRNVDDVGLSEKLENPQAVEQFTDVDKSHWAYYDITEATNTHEFTRRDKDVVVENWFEVKESK